LVDKLTGENTMKYAERIKKYESEKQKLMTTCKTCAEYEREIMKLARRLKI
jgi:hypothetical protein